MNYIKTWDSVTSIKKEKGFETSNIRKCCIGEINTAYGYIWRYYDDELKNTI